MMPVFNAHGLDPAWVEPLACEVEEFFTNLVEELDHDEPRLIQDTTQEELDYIATRAVEAELAKLAGDIGGMENEVTVAAEEEELAEWVKSAKEAGGASTNPATGGVGEESYNEEVEAGDPSATKKRRVPRRASSSEPVQTGRAEARQGAPGEITRVTRAAAAKNEAAMAKKKTTVAKKKMTASSSSKCYRTPSPPPPAGAGTEISFDFSSLSLRGKREAVEEKEEDE